MHLANGQGAADIALFAIAAFVLPALSAWNGVQLRRHPDRSLVSRYALTLARGWLVVGLVAGVWWWTGRPFARLGFDFPVGAAGRLGLLIFAAATLGLGVVLLNLRRFMRPERRQALRRQMQQVKILPRTRRELLVFLPVAVTAGIWEELLYRAFLLWFLAPYIGTVSAAIASSLVFAFGHFYQGWRGAMNAGTLGLLFAFGFVASGSLWWLMAIHALVDVYGGLLSWRVSRMAADDPA